MMCYGDINPKLRTLTGDFMTKKLKYIKLSLRRCVEPASAQSTSKKYCASNKEVEDFYAANPLTRVMYTENHVAISNSTNPLAVAVITDLTMANDPAYNSVFDLYV